MDTDWHGYDEDGSKRNLGKDGIDAESKYP